jgi:4-amino-4-deoxy-L-arabinose transferase-like glycosyltransferase
MSELRPPTRTERRSLIALLVLTALLRLGVICWKPESLAEDRDLYWGLAQRMAAGDGYMHPDWGHRTAYRPPLYPLLLCAIISCGGGVKSLAVVQIVLSVATTWLTWWLARKLELKSGALLATAFVALNPLLVQMTALAMTETLCGFLLIALLACSVEGAKPQPHAPLGVLFGLAALCRPTVWAFAILACIASVLCRWWCRSLNSSRSFGLVVRGWLAIVFATVVTVAPWAIRNGDLFRELIVTTTHGGYTLYLGNNDEAYRAEVVNPTGTPWDSRAWQQTLPQPFPGEGADHEWLRDRWMSQQARTWIRQHPREFAELCWLRIKRFWNIFPGGSDAGSLPKTVQRGMAVFFAIELLAAAVGLWRLRRDEWSRWWPLVLLVLSFALVHVVYWSNLRMRAPVEPVLALLAARGLASRREKD